MTWNKRCGGADVRHIYKGVQKKTTFYDTKKKSSITRSKFLHLRVGYLRAKKKSCINRSASRVRRGAFSFFQEKENSGVAAQKKKAEVIYIVLHQMQKRPTHLRKKKFAKIMREGGVNTCRRGTWFS